MTKLISWNVNGIRACVGKGFLDFFQEADADIFCLQETKLQEGQIDLELPGYHQYWNYAKKKGYSIELVYIGLESSDLAWARVASRAARGGHSVPYEDVIRRFARSLENLPKAIALADKATILDNSTQGYRLIQVAK